MFEWIFGLDSAVQVAALGAFTGAVAGIFGLIKVLLTPHDNDKEKEYGPKPTTIILSDRDRAAIDKLQVSIDNHADAIERHRVELGRGINQDP